MAKSGLDYTTFADEIEGVLWAGDLSAAGFIPTMLDIYDPRPAVEQLDARYAHGGGWRPFSGFTLVRVNEHKIELKYPGDPPVKQLAVGQLRDELIHVMQYGWVCVVKDDGTHEIARMD
jgi:hypothetical protein